MRAGDKWWKMKIDIEMREQRGLVSRSWENELNITIKYNIYYELTEYR